jgi:hypothetical protein
VEDDDEDFDLDLEKELPPIRPPDAANAVFGTYINKNPINIAATADFRSAFHIVFARDSNGVLELELNEDVDGLLQSK